jgi:hypothetical protein
MESSPHFVPLSSAPISSPYLTAPQAAQYLQLSAGTLAGWRMQKNHPLKFVLCATRVRYTIADLDAFVSGCNVRRKASPNVGRPPKNQAKKRKP